MPQMLAHERLSPASGIRLSSDRAFGMVLGSVLALASAAPLLRSRPVNWYLLLAAGVVWAAAFIYPASLHPLHWLGTRIAIAIHRVMSPILMAVLFFGILTPAGLLMRLAGRRTLSPRLSQSYWRSRESEPVHSMKVPF